MGYTKKFMSGETYSAQDVNSVFSALTTQGVSLFNYSSGDSPLVDLNEAISNFTGPGLEFYNKNSCKVTYDDGTGIFKISNGNAWFVDGSFITVDSSGIDITDRITEIRKNSANDIYVYFFRDVSINDILVMADTSTTEYQNVNSVALARISNDNSIYDLRKFSKSKVAPCTSNIYDEGELQSGIIITSTNKNGKIIATITSPMSGYAEYFYWSGIKLCEIQSTTSSELIYDNYSGQIGTIGVAVRQIDTGFEVWAKWISGSSTSFTGMKYLIF